VKRKAEVRRERKRANYYKGPTGVQRWGMAISLICVDAMKVSQALKCGAFMPSSCHSNLQPPERGLLRLLARQPRQRLKVGLNSGSQTSKMGGSVAWEGPTHGP